MVTNYFSDDEVEEFLRAAWARHPPARKARYPQVR
jgi:hypothetical protein